MCSWKEVSDHVVNSEHDYMLFSIAWHVGCKVSGKLSRDTPASDAFSQFSILTLCQT